MRILFKRLQKSSLEDIEVDTSILNLSAVPGFECDGMRLIKYLDAHKQQQSFREFLQTTEQEHSLSSLSQISNAPFYEIEALPGQLNISQQVLSPV